MAITFPNVTLTDFSVLGTGTTINVTIPSTAAGSMLAIAGCFSDSVATYTVSCSGDTFVDSGLGQHDNTKVTQKSYVGAFFAPPTSTTTITLTASTTPTFWDIFIWEIAGITSPAFDQKILNATLGSTGPTAGPTGTLSSASEAAITYFDTSATGSTLVFTTGVTTTDGITPGTGSVGSHQIVGSTGALTANGQDGNNNNGSDCYIATFVSGGGGGDVLQAQIWM